MEKELNEAVARVKALFECERARVRARDKITMKDLGDAIALLQQPTPDVPRVIKALNTTIEAVNAFDADVQIAAPDAKVQ
jgi:hypothetical protein